jgi:hypothetical protein
VESGVAGVEGIMSSGSWDSSSENRVELEECGEDLVDVDGLRAAVSPLWSDPSIECRDGVGVWTRGISRR